MKVLVTGGAGFIGSHTVVALIDAGHEPVIVDNLSNSEKKSLDRLRKLTGKDIDFYEFDYQDTAALGKILKSESIEAVIHFAAYKAVAESVADPLKYYQNNVAGFVTLLAMLRDHQVKHIIFSSSAAVYGEPPTDLVTEDTMCQPTSPYGWSKYMDEIILRDFCASDASFRGIALRYFNVVGAHDSAKIGELPKGKPQNLLPIIGQAATGQIPPLTVFGTDYDTQDGTCLRDYIHVMDLARAHVAALEVSFQSERPAYDVYNIGTGKPTSVMQLLTTFEKVNGLKVPYKLGARRPGDPMAYYAAAAKAERELHWKAEKTVEDAVRSAWKWQQTLDKEQRTTS